MKRQRGCGFGPGSFVALVLVGVCFSALGATRASATQPPAVGTDEALRYADALSTAFAHAADVIRPSLVSIEVKKLAKPLGRLPGGRQIPEGIPLDEDLLRRFFGGRLPQQAPQQGEGSGVIVSKDGDILTNNHVVDDADEVTVTLNDGRKLPAKVVGRDPMTDVAVIRVKADDLPAAKLGDSDKVKVGEWVVAAGAPFGLSKTITAGIVSAVGRANVRIADYEDFIQTDAAINPGNSGGPLVNLRGEVIGINTAIASRTGTYNGIGFAIPIDMAKTIMQSLMKEGHVVRGYVGVSIGPLSEGMAKSFGYDSTEGALINDVVAGSPGDKAGLKQGDIITELNGKKVADVPRFRNEIAATEPGKNVKLEVFRDGKPVSVKVELGKLDEKSALASGNDDLSSEAGLTVEDVTADTVRQLGLPKDTRGVVVTEVDANGAAFGQVQAGDFVLDVSGVKIDNAQQFRRELGKHDLKKGVRLLVKSGDAQHFAFLQTHE